ncbi:MAG: metal transporter [Desulfamplus sp.]|nr:metal transporter [Desulfamplus sp.]
MLNEKGQPFHGFMDYSEIFKKFSMNNIDKPRLINNPWFMVDQIKAITDLMTGLYRYAGEFVEPLITATNYFAQVEQSRMISPEQEPIQGYDVASPELCMAYAKLLEFNMEIFSRFQHGTLEALGEMGKKEWEKFFKAMENTLVFKEEDNLENFFSRCFESINDVVNTLPQAIQEIEPEYGFHFERGINPLAAETERFFLYQVMPTKTDVKVDEGAKPLIILPPYVLGSNILSFLPGEDRSYTHCFANQGIPTYIRIMKDIETTPAFQVMTMEEDLMDTRIFCEKIMEKHGKKVTINGYCQGGYNAVCNILSGELDHVVDALITCVSPMDGTRSRGLGSFLEGLPSRFNDLRYGTKTLANGNKVADGNLMGWVYKLKSIEQEAPLVSFFRDMALVAGAKKKGGPIGKTALALNYWLKNERTDIPLAITEMSFAAYNIPVKEDGTLPVTLHGKSLNFKTIKEKGIPWLLCYGESDDLVEKETALAPLDYVDTIEVTEFPKGHVAIATSWSHPDSACPLHGKFGKGNYRGPVKFQMDLNSSLDVQAASLKNSKTKEGKKKK